MNVSRQIFPWIAVVFAIAGGACGGTDRGILEVTLTMPPRDGDLAFFVADVKSGASAFDATDDGHRLTAPLAEASMPYEFEIVGDGHEVEDTFQIRGRFCESDGCEDEVMPLPPVELVFERALYAGERTRFAAELPTIAAMRARTEPLIREVERCQVEGCREGAPVTWCRQDGSHFCE